MTPEKAVESAEHFIKLRRFDDAYEFFKTLPEDLLNDGLEHYVVETAKHFAGRGDLEKGLKVAYLLEEENFEWAAYQVFLAYLREDENTERAKRALELHYIIPDPYWKVDILRLISEVLEREEPDLARTALRLGIEWARRINKRADRYYAFEGLFYTAKSLRDWDSIRRICELLDRRGKRELPMDELDLDKGDAIPDCEEFVEIIRGKTSERGREALDVLIQVYKEHEKDLLRSRGFNPYTHRLKAVKTEDEVRFYVVRRPLTVAILLYLLDRVRGGSAKRSS